MKQTSTDNVLDDFFNKGESMIKAYYVIRKDIKMSKAKLGVQIGHGTDFIHFDGTDSRFGDWSENYVKWINENRRKIVCGISDLNDLEKLTNNLKTDKIGYHEIIDLGFTEFNNVPTLTGIVIYPIDDETIPKYLKRLQTLKD